MKSIIFSVLFLAVSFLTGTAQVVNSGVEKEVFKNRIKLVDGFMTRFNQGGDLIPLFDAQLLGGKNSAEYALAKEFADKASKSGVKLNYSDTLWFATAHCSGKLKNKTVEFTLILNVEKRAKDMYKWVIARAEGDIFRLTPAKNDGKAMIMPDDHETGFQVLGKITANSETEVVNYAQKTFEVDQTSVFFAFVNQGLLDIEAVTDLQFVFFQVPGWEFSIKEFDRMDKNSGWLITSFKKISDRDKNTFLKNVYSKKN